MWDFLYWVCGLAVTAGIPVKFGTAHGRSTTEVGGAKCIDAYGSGGVSRSSLVLGNSEQNIIAIFDILRTIHNFYSLTIVTKQERKQSFAHIDFNAEPHYQVPFAMTVARSKYGKPASSV